MTPLIGVDARPLYRIPRSKWVSDRISEAEMKAAIASLPEKDRKRYAFVRGNYEKVVEMSGGIRDIDALDLETLLLLAWSNDTKGLNRPHIMQRYYIELQRRDIPPSWASIVEKTMQHAER